MKSLIALTWSLISFLISSPGPVFWPALVVTSTIVAMIAARIRITRMRPIRPRTRLAVERRGAAAAGDGAAGRGRGRGAGGGAGARRGGAVPGSVAGRWRVDSVGAPIIARVAASLSARGGSLPD